jgi:small subunit ribosomal protein S13
MVFFFEVPLNKNIYLYYSLTTIYGLGLARSILICRLCGIQKNAMISSLNSSQWRRLKNIINLHFVVGSRLIQEKKENLKFLIDLNSYKGFRHKKKFPVRGQRTRTNAKTQRRVFL